MLVDDFGQSKVTILKVDLLATIQANRETHQKEHLEAFQGFQAAALHAMEENIRLYHSTGEVKLSISLRAPIEHTKDYDRVIKMLTMSTADEITISEEKFTQYVMDEWAWKAEHIGSTAMYGNTVRR